MAQLPSAPTSEPSGDDVRIGVEPLPFDPFKKLSPSDQLQERSWLAYTVLWLTVILEVMTATFNILFMVFSASSDIPYIEFVLTGYPRIILFLTASYLTNKRKWWQQYLKVLRASSRYHKIKLMNNIKFLGGSSIWWLYY
jgi:hypothetical protein